MTLLTYEVISINIVSVCVCTLAVIILHANHILSASYYFDICGLSGCTIIFHIIS